MFFNAKTIKKKTIKADKNYSKQQTAEFVKTIKRRISSEVSHGQYETSYSWALTDSNQQLAEAIKTYFATKNFTTSLKITPPDSYWGAEVILTISWK